MELLQKLGAIAGIAGIVAGIFLILFREVIRKSVFPKLTKAHGYKTIRLILFLTWSFAIVGIAAWVYTKKAEVQPGKTSPKVSIATDTVTKDEVYDPLILVRKDSLPEDSNHKKQAK